MNVKSAGVSGSNVGGVTNWEFQAKAQGALVLGVYVINNTLANATLADGLTAVTAPVKVNTITTAGPQDSNRVDAGPAISIGIQYACENGYDVAY